MEMNKPPPEYLTHYHEHSMPPWLAIHRASALECLEDYDLTEEEKNDIGAMMAGYCNLLENAGLCGYGKTEAEAIERSGPANTEARDAGRKESQQ